MYAHVFPGFTGGAGLGSEVMTTRSDTTPVELESFGSMFDIGGIEEKPRCAKKYIVMLEI
jgi:hypothetical protein